MQFCHFDNYKFENFNKYNEENSHSFRRKKHQVTCYSKRESNLHKRSLCATTLICDKTEAILRQKSAIIHLKAPI